MYIPSKICTKCKCEKSLDLYYKNKYGKDGHKPECKECSNKKIKEFKESEHGSKYIKAYGQAWSKRFAYKKNDSWNRRQAAQLQATPKWANLSYIKSFYKQAKEIEAKFGIKYEVDHIVPLRSSKVCGLHCEHNLRVIPATENRSKGNRVWPDSPETLGSYN